LLKSVIVAEGRLD